MEALRGHEYDLHAALTWQKELQLATGSISNWQLETGNWHQQLQLPLFVQRLPPVPVFWS